MLRRIKIKIMGTIMAIVLAIGGCADMPKLQYVPATEDDCAVQMEKLPGLIAAFGEDSPRVGVITDFLGSPTCRQFRQFHPEYEVVGIGDEQVI